MSRERMRNEVRVIKDKKSYKKGVQTEWMDKKLERARNQTKMG